MELQKNAKSGVNRVNFSEDEEGNNDNTVFMYFEVCAAYFPDPHEA